MSDLDQALAWAREFLRGGAVLEGVVIARALLAEHERAEANAADARRWNRLYHELLYEVARNAGQWTSESRRRAGRPTGGIA